MTKLDSYNCYYIDGDIMRIYFIFKIKDEFISLYKDNQRVLYNILRQIYYLDKSEVTYGYNLFSQLILPIDKNKLDRDLFIKFHQDIPYLKRNDVHIINNLYKDEISRLTIRKCYMKLEIEQKFSSFFNIIGKYSDNLFVCEFYYHDFFFLNEMLNDSKVLN